MSDIVIYQQEIMDGISEQVRTNASIAYIADIKPIVQENNIEETLKACNIVEQLAKDGSPDGLFAYDSIFVSTGWNLNCDVFDKEQTWIARHTPINKPVNREHNGDDIVGHIVASVAVDDNGTLIPADTDFESIPDDFNLRATSVIYRQWESPEKTAEIHAFIEEIIRGEWKVSMEAHFKGFDYVLKPSKGDTKIITRNNSTAFLTKYLRRYGGSGVYGDYTVGRLLKNLTFSGKGIVRQPANPKSEVERTYSFASSTKIEETLKMESSQMSSEATIESMKKELEDAKAALKTEQEAKATLESRINESTTKAHKEAIDKLKASLESAEASVTELKAEVEKSKTMVAQAEKDVVEATKKAKEAEDEMDKMKKNAKSKARIDVLVKTGKTEDEAKALVEKFDNLNDEQFDAVAAMVQSNVDINTNKDENATANVLNNANPTDSTTLGTEAEIEKAGSETVRAHLTDIFSSFLSEK